MQIDERELRWNILKYLEAKGDLWASTEALIADARSVDNTTQPSDVHRNLYVLRKYALVRREPAGALEPERYFITNEGRAELAKPLY